MKLYNLLIVGLSMLFLGSCGNSFVTEDYYDLEELPGYVAFDADGNNATLAPFEVTEGDGSLNVTVENPTGTVSDITVDYSLGGTAVFGTDYDISGASSSGGSMTIAVDGSAFNETFRGDIVITLLTDEVVDGEKTIELTLTGASNSEGTVAIGRGGTELLRTATVIISDVDE